MAISRLCATTLPPEYIEYVYYLRCPISFDIFYVGKTKDPKYRLDCHIQESIRSEKITDKRLTIRNIVSNNSRPIMFIVDKTEIRTPIDKMYAHHKEYHWINFYQRMGWNLTNIATVDSNHNRSDYSLYLKGTHFRDSYKWYYYKKDSSGDDVYDNTRLKKDGFATPYENQRRELEKIRIERHMEEMERHRLSELGYTPWKNPRFTKLVERNAFGDSCYYDTTAYKDLNPDYYDEDY